MMADHSTIGVRAVGEIEDGVLEYLLTPIREAFGAVVQIDVPLSQPTYAFDRSRGQYLAPLVVHQLAQKRPENEYRSLGVTSVDLFAPDLNFVFGLASPKERAAVISLVRLRPEFYDLPPDNGLFRQRVIKEALHELGHTFGLNHCANRRCVMHFSNTIHDTDVKEARFCSRCQL